MKPDFEIKKVKCYNVDCMEFMKIIPDNFYELAIVDPPYGIGAGSNNFKNGTSKGNTIGYREIDWDSIIPDKSYFTELKRISKHQIIWGGNYFAHLLEPSRGWIVWDKGTGKNSYADGELAYTSFDKVLKIIKKTWVGANAKDTVVRIHPTQKPVALYKWTLTKYAKFGDKILDTHGGSFSSACACLDMGFDIDICEIDKEYFDNAVNRLKNNVQEYLEF